MNRVPPTVVFFPGGGGGWPELPYDPSLFGLGELFKRKEDDAIRFEPIQYPDWRQFVADGFSADVFLSQLVEQIVARVPHGRVWIVGFSLGGHFGYACALRLQAIGREIAGFCAIDAYMMTSSEPRPGWKRRHLEEARRLWDDRRFSDLALFVRKRFWRVQLRLFPPLLRFLARSERGRALAALDPVLDHELRMRVFIGGVAPWIGSLDRDPVAINAPAALLRTQEMAGDDVAWRRRCPNIEIVEIDGDHTTWLDPENAGSFRKAFAAATHNWGACMANEDP
jgi:thioesterase domain-containing protein